MNIILARLVLLPLLFSAFIMGSIHRPPKIAVKKDRSPEREQVLTAGLYGNQRAKEQDADIETNGTPAFPRMRGIFLDFLLSLSQYYFNESTCKLLFMR